MSNSINIKSVVNSSVEGTQVYSFGFANVEYDLSTQAVADLFREFVVTKANSQTYSGMVKMTSNVTGLDYHSGKGDEEFIGTLTHVFENTSDASYQNILPDTSDYFNYTYTAVRDGLNRTIWSMNTVSTPTDYIMVLHVGTTNTTQNDATKRYILFNTGESPSDDVCYLISNGTKHEFNSSHAAILQNVVLSSKGRGIPDSSYFHTDEATNPYINRNEFLLFRVNGENPVSSIYLRSYESTSWKGFNLEFRRMSSRDNFPEFATAVGTSNAFISRSNFPNYRHPVTNRSAAQIIGLFDKLIGTVSSLQKGVLYDVATSTITLPP